MGLNHVAVTETSDMVPARVWIHSETCTWHNNNTQSCLIYLQLDLFHHYPSVPYISYYLAYNSTKQFLKKYRIFCKYPYICRFCQCWPYHRRTNDSFDEVHLAKLWFLQIASDFLKWRWKSLTLGQNLEAIITSLALSLLITKNIALNIAKLQKAQLTIQAKDKTSLLTGFCIAALLK